MQKIRGLSKDLAIYGLGDVAIQAINFALVYVYVNYLSWTDYGILALLGSVETVAKLFFRWGVDGSFMRFWYDCEDESARQRLSSTLFFFLLAVNGVLLAASLVVAPFASRWLLEAPGYTLALQLVLLNTFAIGFTFIPFHVLRMEKRAREFSALTFARSAATLVLRFVLLVGAGMGVFGIVIADVVVTTVLMVVMLRWFAPLIRPVFSRAILRESLAFGLPRLPHGLAQQVIAVGDKFILKLFKVPMDLIGVYQMGVSFGMIQKLFLAAFEYAWAPFYYATVREPGAQRTFSAITTYVIAILALMTAGLSAIAGDLLHAVARAKFDAAAGVIPWIAVGVLLQGIYLLTSIGLNITRHTRYYPVATWAAAGANLALNVTLIPRYGFIGAAWANAAAYGVQAAVAFRFSQRFYPIQYEYGRIVKVLAAAALGYVAAVLLPDMRSIVAVLVRGSTVLAVTSLVLLASGFFRPTEVRRLGQLLRRRPEEPTEPTAVAPLADTTEFAGEIVSTELPDPALGAPERRDRQR